MSETIVAPGAGVPLLSDVHRAYLNSHAVCDKVIAAAGIASDGDYIAFPWRDGDLFTVQRRKWTESTPDGQAAIPDDGPKYLWEPGHPLHFAAWRPVRDDEGPVIIAEGTKQSLAVASWAPPDYAVYGMAGCDGWRNLELTRLGRFENRDVIIMLDADAASNSSVYEAGELLAATLDLEGARPVFVRSPAWGKDGIDDVLGTEPVLARRTEKIVKLIAKAQAKPADKKPARRKQAVPAAQQPETGGPPAVVVNKSRLDVLHEIIGALRARWDARELFCYGDVLTRLRVTVNVGGISHEARTEPLSRDSFLRWLPEGVACYKYHEPTALSPGRYEDAWPDRETISALMASGDEFAPLDRVARTPFLRPDGTVCAKNGYDPPTRTMLVTGNSGMDRLDIPDSPSQADAAAAASLLLDTWLGPREGREGMPFRDPSSRANALALILTPFIRGTVPLVPLAVISGIQMGVGKNLLADCISIVATGSACVPLPWIPDDDDEVRKQILSTFRAGSSLFCFDEAHSIDSIALSRALTSITYSDRVLGASTMASYPNFVTWMALGNNVAVDGDMRRRFYKIELFPAGRNPQDRVDDTFAHPDLRGWTAENRPELVTAILVMLRAWFAAGRPAAPRGASMGSFEAWDKMMSGVLAYAGVTGFLDTLREQRAESDFSGSYWHDHFEWLAKALGTGREFVAADVKRAGLAAGGGWESPPGLANLNDPDFNRGLGKLYASIRDRWLGDFRLVKTGTGHRKVAKWMLEAYSAGDPPVSPDSSGGIPPRVNPSDPSIPPATPSAFEGNEGSQEEGRDGEGSPQPRVDKFSALSVPFTATEDSGSTQSDIKERKHEITTVTEYWGSLPIPPSLRASVHPLVTPKLSLAFDLEGGSADELFTYQPYDETGYVRLAGVIGASGKPVITDAATLLPLLGAADEITGHNILGFDLLALAWHHGADYRRLAAKARDTELIARQADPPRSRDTHSADSYGLDDVARRLGLPGKTDDLKRLNQLHGGYDKIPLDDPQYRSYLEGDLHATAAVSAAMRERYRPDPYVAREHRLAVLAGQMTLNGFRVDKHLLEQRLREGEERKAGALEQLHAGWDLPLTKMVARGRGSARAEHEEPVKSPLSTDAGRAWLAAQYERYQVPDPPRTAKAGKLALGAEDLKPLLADPRTPGDLRGMLTLMGIVTTTRTVYQTASNCLTAQGRVHPGNSFRQASGRWSVTNPGLTVFGKRGGRHVERDIFLADEGDVLLSFDLSQVDMRAMAWLSGDRAYRALFAEGRDAHAEIAAQVGIERQDAKAIGHGWNYGLGRARMIADGLDPVKVDAFIAGMQQRFPVLIAWREEIRERGKAGDILDNGFGRRMACDPARAYTVAPALMGQGGARDIMGACLLKLDESLWPLLRVMVHDEVLLSVPKADARDVAWQVKQAMTWNLDHDLPVLCDMAAGMTWGECSVK